MTTPHTYLFVPGNRPERFDKALACGADAVVLDLEDAVAAEDKERARGLVGQRLLDAPAGERARIVVVVDDAEHPPLYQRPPVVTSLDYSPDGKLLAVISKTVLGPNGKLYNPGGGWGWSTRSGGWPGPRSTGPLARVSANPSARALTITAPPW